MNKIEHIGIAVKDLDLSCDLYEKLLGVAAYKRELVASEGVSTAFFLTGENKIELLAATEEDSPIAAFIQKKGEGIHHIAFEVSNIYEEMERLKNKGFVLLSGEPRVGADNKLICFVHPKGTNGVLVELCQEIKAEANG
ncbi:methylmalonyl-CoA epimerase [Pedobacter hartonius]|uniref:Methylmalonyl-CoA epimerase n=1 Tax=Pedobacter hartonius TaxID=425514 RepID=A0A1H3WIN9_9SPHI|nr:methylmalonyl-CoA epimerase [Pedobacter hartonius]SDZ86983.1 methylmalonyl-CoA epimerase [Pedobacter hartonius]